jgi:hypothetical protein
MAIWPHCADQVGSNVGNVYTKSSPDYAVEFFLETSYEVRIVARRLARPT